MMDQYKIMPPGGENPWVLRIEPGTTVAVAYEQVAEKMHCEVSDLSLSRRNPPGAALPFFHLLRTSDAPLRRDAPSGSVLVAELEGGPKGQARGDAVDGGSAQAAASTSGDAPRAVAPAEVPLASPINAVTGSDTSCPAKPLIERPADQRGLVGLENLGNTCYMNSAVQCLSQTRLLTNPLVEDTGAKVQGSVASSFTDVVRSLWAPHGNGDAYCPRALKTAIADRAEIFKGYRQQDSQEFVQAFLEGLHEDLKRPAVPSSEQQQTSDAAADRVAWQKALATDASRVSDAFQGQLQSTVTCLECGHAEVTYELFWSLPLPMPNAGRDGGQPMLEDALQLFCAEEPLEAGWHCPHCDRSNVRATKRFSLWRLPLILVAQLKRFEWQMPGKSTSVSSTAVKEPPNKGTSKETEVIASLVGDSLAGANGDIATQSLAAQVDQARAEGDTAAPSGAATVAAQVDKAKTLPEPKAVVVESASLDTSSKLDANVGAMKVDDDVVLDPLKAAAALPWEVQEKMYNLILRMLTKIAESPDEEKFRSVGKTSAKLRADVLDVGGPVGTAMLCWAGFEEVDDRFAARTLTQNDAQLRCSQLVLHAEDAKMQSLRRERDERIAEERRRILPTGSSQPIRRWGGRLPGFGFGAQSATGLACKKIEVRVGLPVASDQLRGFEKLCVAGFIADGAPHRSDGEESVSPEFEAYGVVEHIGHSPFSGHYVATCWHAPSSAWWRFNDSHVSRISQDRQAIDVFTSGSYVVFLERC